MSGPHGAAAPQAGPAVDTEVWLAACPRCRRALGPLPSEPRPLGCEACAASYPCREGIWQFLPPEREELYTAFLRDYTAVRHAEGRWSDDPGYYRALPEVPASDPMAWQWQIRAQTFRHFSRLLRGFGAALRIVDVGAGTGWLSHRLAELGHQPCAVDLSVDARDGLGASRHLGGPWPRLQAEFDRLPLADAQADLVVFNGALHYSVDYRVTLLETLRVLRPQGRIVVLESPIYRHHHSGAQMVAERHAAFERKYGTRSDSVASREFLTWGLLDELASELGLRWAVHSTWYGWRWALRPWQAWWRGAREPSRFAILAGRRSTEARP